MNKEQTITDLKSGKEYSLIQYIEKQAKEIERLKADVERLETGRETDEEVINQLDNENKNLIQAIDYWIK